MRDKNYVEPSLFDAEEIPHELLKEWEGLPEFKQMDLTPSKQLIISFRNSEDYRAFGELIGQPITLKTKSVWFPKAEITKYMDKQYKYIENDNTQE